MPSTSKKQHNLMAMVANDPAAAKRLKIPQSVGQEFVKADTGMKFGKGTSERPDLQKINRPKTLHGKSTMFASGGEVKKESNMKQASGITTAKMGAVKTAAPSRDGLATKGKTKGKQVKMTGSKPLGMKKGGKC